MARDAEADPERVGDVVESTPEALVVEATYGPGGKPPPKHFHPHQDERFRVLEGTLSFRLGGDRARARGRRGDRHSAGGRPSGLEPARRAGEGDLGDARRRLRTEQWFRAVDAVVREAGDKTPSPLAFATLLSEYRDCFRLAVGPDPLVGPVIKALGAVGRLRGHGAK